jgi:hypothetical protein
MKQALSGFKKLKRKKVNNIMKSNGEVSAVTEHDPEKAQRHSDEK